MPRYGIMNCIFLSYLLAKGLCFLAVNLTEEKAAKFLKLNSHIFNLLSEEIIKSAGFYGFVI